MNPQYTPITTVLPGRVAESFTSLFKGEMKNFNSNYAKASRRDCTSFEIEGIYQPKKENSTEENSTIKFPFMAGGEIIHGLGSLEYKIRALINLGNPQEITVIKTAPELDQYTIHYSSSKN